MNGNISQERLSAVQALVQGQAQGSDLVCQSQACDQFMNQIEIPDKPMDKRTCLFHTIFLGLCGRPHSGEKCIIPTIITGGHQSIKSTCFTKRGLYRASVDEAFCLMDYFLPQTSSISSCPLASSQASPESMRQGLLRYTPSQDPISSQRVFTSPLLLEPFPPGTCHSFQPRGESSPCHVSR